jgi:UDP-N-acetylmuramyl pentapeptide phosphotransferase/UDP-N-acetylglucosamine-1-phosphate transferase
MNSGLRFAVERTEPHPIAGQSRRATPAAAMPRRLWYKLGHVPPASTAMTALLLTAVLVFAASWGGSGLMTGWLRRRMILDHPVERSSHDRPVPKGGGVAVSAALLLGWLDLAVMGLAPPETLLVCCLAFALAALSWFNDVTDVPAPLRLAVHLLIATAGLLALPDRGQVFQGLLSPDLDEAATVLLWAWFLNLFNFMDGIDGITAVQTAAIGFGLAFVAALTGLASGGYLLLVVALAAAALGFLPWNWHPARVFLGDAGSVPLGFVAGWLLLLLASRGYWASALLLPLYYFADASLTLLARAVRGEAIWRAHRSHFYQRALAPDGDHGAVALWILGGNLGLIGAAVMAIWHPMPALALGAAITAVLIAKLALRGRRSPVAAPS